MNLTQATKGNPHSIEDNTLLLQNPDGAPLHSTWLTPTGMRRCSFHGAMAHGEWPLFRTCDGIEIEVIRTPEGVFDWVNTPTIFSNDGMHVLIAYEFEDNVGTRGHARMFNRLTQQSRLVGTDIDAHTALRFLGIADGLVFAVDRVFNAETSVDMPRVFDAISSEVIEVDALPGARTLCELSLTRDGALVALIDDGQRKLACWRRDARWRTTPAPPEATDVCVVVVPHRRRWPADA
jgi:hypothetical protein